MSRNPPTELKRDRSTNRAYVRWQGDKTYFGKWGSQESFTKFAAWLREVTGEPDEAPSHHSILLTDCVSRYLLHCETYYSLDGKPTQEFINVRRSMGVLLEFIDEGFLAIDFGPKLLKALQKSLVTAKTEGTASKPAKLRYARTTINAMIGRIQRCIRWCASEELIPVQIATALETVDHVPKGRTAAREPARVTAVSFQVVADTIPHLSPTVAAMVQVQALCGMRPQDVCGMTTGAIDASGDVWLYRPWQHKGRHLDKDLIKGIPKPAQEILRPFLRSGPTEPIFSPADSRKFWNNGPQKSKRGFYRTSAYGTSIRRAIARSNKTRGSLPPVPHWAPNQLRHAIATELRRTAGIEAAQLYLGHSKPDTTLIYAEKTLSALVEVARNFVSPLVAHKPECG